jgi:hypothetical protein
MTTTRTDPLARLQAAAGAVPGALLGAVFGLTAAVRRTKPLHPLGRTGSGVLEVTSPQRRLGIPLLEARGHHRCTVRWSRSVGLPAPLPDIEGLAVRLDAGGDLLFSATGTGTLSRFVLLPRLPGRHGPQSTLLPVRTDAGSLLLKVTPLDDEEPPTRWELAVAGARSEWRAVGVLEVVWGDGDQPLRFDPVAHQLPGTSQYPLVTTLREPAYAAARRGAEPRA